MSDITDAYDPSGLRRPPQFRWEGNSKRVP